MLGLILIATGSLALWLVHTLSGRARRTRIARKRRARYAVLDRDWTVRERLFGRRAVKRLTDRRRNDRW